MTPIDTASLTPVAAAHATVSARRVAERQSACEHRSLFWYLNTNEEGWHCADCDLQPGEPAGFSPQHDRSHLRVKVRSILSGLHDAGIVHVSNGDRGEYIVATVATICNKLEVYDQYAIASRILLHLASSHTEYWDRIAEGILAGKDGRNRCPCGALSTSTRCGTPPQYRCSEHWTWDEETDDELRARLGISVPGVSP